MNEDETTNIHFIRDLIKTFIMKQYKSKIFYHCFIEYKWVFWGLKDITVSVQMA